MNLPDSCYAITSSNLFYKILTAEADYELLFGKKLTESQIIDDVIWLPLSNTADEIGPRLKYLYACIAFGNCVRVNAALQSILVAINDLQQNRQHLFDQVSTTVLELLEKIVLTAEMTTSWRPHLPKILKIFICGFRYDTKSTSKVAMTMVKVAATIPVTKSLNVLLGYTITEYEDIQDYDQLLWSLKLLSLLVVNQGNKLTYRYLRKIRSILIMLTDDNSTLVSETSIHALVDLYVYTGICEKKNRIQQELERLIPESMDTVKNYYEKMHYFFYEIESTQPKYSILSAKEIIKIACEITPSTPFEARKRALFDFCTFLSYENCEEAIRNFRPILLMLMKLLRDATTCKEFVIALNVLEEIFRCKPMKPYWTEYYREILLRIMLSYDIDKDTTEAIDSFIQNTAGNLPVTETVRIVDTLLVTAEYPYNLCAMKLLFEVAGQHKLFPKTNLDKLLPTVVRSINDPDKNIRLVAECVIYKLCVKLGEQRVTSVINRHQIADRRLRVLLTRTRRFS